MALKFTVEAKMGIHPASSFLGGQLGSAYLHGLWRLKGYRTQGKRLAEGLRSRSVWSRYPSLSQPIIQQNDLIDKPLQRVHRISGSQFILELLREPILKANDESLIVPPAARGKRTKLDGIFRCTVGSLAKS